MAALKHPCVGDLTYGADPALAKRVGLERQWLHAVRLGFEHPDTGDHVEYESTYPADLAHALEVVRDGTDAAGPAAAAGAPSRTCPRSPPCTSGSATRRTGCMPPRVHDDDDVAAGWGLDLARGEVWVAEADGDAVGYARVRRGLARRPLRRTRTRPGRASAAHCSTWSRRAARTASACGSS